MTSRQLVSESSPEFLRAEDDSNPRPTKDISSKQQLSSYSSTPKPKPVTPSSILAVELLQLSQQAETLLGLDNSFKAKLKAASQLAAGLEPYMEACSTPESEALAALTHKTQLEDWSRRFSAGETVGELEQEMLSGHIEGQFLKLLLPSISAKRVLEIGLFTGYSALAMAEVLPDDGVLIACEIDAYASQFARDCFDSSAHGHKIKIEVGPALPSIQALAAAGESFDFVFIDADKGGYLDYLNLLLESSLLAPNGLICVDNTLMQGQPYMPGESTDNGKAIAHFNEAVAKDNRVQQVILPIRDGITLIRRS